MIYPDTEARLKKVFGEPDLFTGSGNAWYRIATLDQAELATSLSQTAVSFFWNIYQENPDIRENHEWLIMVSGDRAEVAMVARIEDRQHPDTGDASGAPLKDCHITGYRNECPLPTHEADIREACLAFNLAYTPNHMGNPIFRENDGPSP